MFDRDAWQNMGFAFTIGENKYIKPEGQLDFTIEENLQPVKYGFAEGYTVIPSLIMAYIDAKGAENV